MRVLSFDVGLRNLAYALVTYNRPEAASNSSSTSWSQFHVEAWEHFDVLKECGCTAKDSKKVGIERCIKMVFQCLDRRPQLFDQPVDFIIIEKQMRRSPRNLMTSVALLSYFVIKSPDTQVDMISSTGKLKINLEPEAFAFSDATPSVLHHTNDPALTAAQNKTRRKNKAIQLCTQLLSTQGQHLQPWSKRFTSKELAKKRDDLADCLLQAVYFLQDKLQVTKPKKRKGAAGKKTASAEAAEPQSTPPKKRKGGAASTDEVESTPKKPRASVAGVEEKTPSEQAEALPKKRKQSAASTKEKSQPVRSKTQKAVAITVTAASP